MKYLLYSSAVLAAFLFSPVVEAMDSEKAVGAARTRLYSRRELPDDGTVYSSQEKAIFRHNVVSQFIESQNAKMFLNNYLISNFLSQSGVNILIDGVRSGNEAKMRQGASHFFNFLEMDAGKMTLLAGKFWLESPQGQLDMSKLGDVNSPTYKFATKGRQFVLESNIPELKKLVDEAIPLLVGGADPQSTAASVYKKS